MNKRIGLVVVIAAIVGAILYLEGVKSQPAPSGAIYGPQPIGLLPAESGSLPAASSSKPRNPAPSLSLQSIAAADAKAGYRPAVEIADPTGFINASDTFMLKELVGKKVILLDFWTYSCINCIRTLPYLTSWYQKYKNRGFIIVGVHTPEFDFEKDINNVRAATQKYGIEYPVVLDGNHGTWDAYGNLYWPREYFIDIAGYIVHDQIGEGNYEETEAKVQELLRERAMALGAPMPAASSGVAVRPADLSGIGSPETYFGAARNEFLANGQAGAMGGQVLREPQSVSLNRLYLVGNWNFQDEYASNNAVAAKIIYKYRSAKVFFVASAPAGAVLEVIQDGNPASASAGSDVRNGKVEIKESRLYNLIDNPDGPGDHTLELIIDSPGLRAYTFTFG